MSLFRTKVASTGAVLATLALLSACVLTGIVPASASCPEPAAAPSGASHPAPSAGDDLVIVGRVLTMSEPAEAEALLIEGGLVTCIGGRDEVLARAGDDVRVVDIGSNVAYPGFIDAHAHWIGDREYYGIATAKEAIDAAVSRGWTSISEQWVNPERLDELTTLAEADALSLRVDGYLALNFGLEFFGDWYADHEPGSLDDRLRVRGVKIHLDDAMGATINWEPDVVTETIGRADEAGWQVSVHTVSTEAQEVVLDAFEAAIGPDGPNPLHHRIEHLLEVSDEQLDRLVAMDLATVIHPDGGSVDWVLWTGTLGHGADYPEAQLGWLTRFRDFLDAGLHVAVATDAPWFFPDHVLAEDVGRPLDLLAAGMDGRARAHDDPPDWILEHLLAADEGLRAMTLDAAHALGDEARRGHLAPGTLGDVTILSGDVRDATPDEIRAMTVVATVVGGVIEHCADAAICPAP